jgi:hypothetical protein
MGGESTNLIFSWDNCTNFPLKLSFCLSLLQLLRIYAIKKVALLVTNPCIH